MKHLFIIIAALFLVLVNTGTCTAKTTLPIPDKASKEAMQIVMSVKNQDTAFFHSDNNDSDYGFWVLSFGVWDTTKDISYYTCSNCEPDYLPYFILQHVQQGTDIIDKEYQFFYPVEAAKFIDKNIGTKGWEP